MRMSLLVLCISASLALEAAEFSVVPNRCYRLRGVFTSDRPCAVKFGVCKEAKGVKAFYRYGRYEIADGTCAIEADYWLPPVDEEPALRDGLVSVVFERIRGEANLEGRDFSLVEIPYPTEPKPFLRTDGTQTNGLLNSSFELGLAPHGFQAKVSCEQGAAKPTVGIDCQTAVHGKKSLKIDNRVGCRRVDFMTTMAGLPETAKKGVASLYLKADRPTRITVVVQDYYHDLIRQKELQTAKVSGFSVGTEWRRYEVVFDVDWPLYRRAMRICLETPAIVWADALQIEPGEKATDYAPASPVEAVMDLDEHVFVRHAADETKNIRQVRLGVANYTGRQRTVECCTEFGAATVRLSPEGAAEKTLPFNLSRFGAFEAGGEIRSEGFCGQIVPVGYAVVGEPPLAADKGFCQGVNYCSDGIAYLSPTTEGKDWHLDDVAFYDWDGKTSFEERFRQMRLAGNRTALLSAVWPRIEIEKGRFAWSATDLLVNSARKAGLEVLLSTCTPTAHFSPYEKDRMANWFGRRNSKPGKVSWPGTQAFLPDLRDWTDYHRALLTHYHGQVKFLECVGEPNGTMPDADAYVSYLKIVHDLRDELVPDALMTGICTTGDFDSDTGRFIREVGERGGFRFFDLLSFHPYGAPIDVANWQGIDAEDQYRQIRQLTDAYEKDKRLLQTEVFYLDDGRLRPMGGKRDAIGLHCDWPAGYLARRVALDLAYGAVESMSLSASQYYRSVPGSRTAAISDRFPTYLNPSDRFVVGNALMRILEGAIFLDKPKVSAEQNAFRFRTREGRIVRLQWCRGHVYSRTIELKPGEKAYDVFGNPILKKKFTLTYEPVYIFES